MNSGLTSPMWLVHAFCEKDWESAIRFFERCLALSGAPERTPCMLVHPKFMDQTIVQEVTHTAYKAFSKVTNMAADPSPKNWNAKTGDASGPNLMFRNMAAYANQQLISAWLWTEPDCLPVKKGWFNAIELEYAKAGKPFMGAVYSLPIPHMNGVAVYPQNVARWVPEMIYPPHPTLAWDLCAPHKVMRFLHETRLIQRSLKHPSLMEPYQFEAEEDVLVIRKETVLFHGCRYDDRISGLLEHKPEVAIPTVDVSSLIQKVRQVLPPPRELPAIVQLGRIGDILNILPVARFYNSICHHQPIYMVVHDSMAHVLNRVGYVRTYTVKGPLHNKEAGILEAQKVSDEIMVPQLFNGKGVDKWGCSNYNIDQWKLCGCENMWGELPMEIDRRDWKAEEAWFQTVRKTDKPLICYNLSGQSSPFKEAQRFESWIRDNFEGDCELLNLDNCRVRFYCDQLGALDRCHLLITTDTASVHLAQASHCPYIALLSDLDQDGWKATALLRKPVLGIPYNKVMGSLEAIWEAVVQAISKTFVNRKIWHCVSRRETHEPRVDAAIAAWQPQYKAGLMEPCHVWDRDVKRTAKNILGDTRALPFLRDVLQAGLDKAGDEDMIVFTNDDCVITERALKNLQLKLRFTEIVTASRIDLRGGVIPTDTSGDMPWQGSRHLGRELAAFRAGWLRKNLWAIPDMVLGSSEWDLVVAVLARKMCGIKSTNTNIGLMFPQCELPAGSVFHQRHVGYWSLPEVYSKAPSQRHNSMLAEELFRTQMPSLELDWFKRV